MYDDLRGFSWTEAQRVYALEEELMARVQGAEDPAEEYDAIEEELYETPDGLFGLDIGVASTVLALSAARCVPFSSCNAGAFGGRHYERHPLVAFCAKPHVVPLLLACAEKAGVGLVNNIDGYLIVYAGDILGMRAFANILIQRRRDFRALRASPKRMHRSTTALRKKQLPLFEF